MPPDEFLRHYFVELFNDVMLILTLRTFELSSYREAGCVYINNSQSLYDVILNVVLIKCISYLIAIPNSYTDVSFRNPFDTPTSKLFPLPHIQCPFFRKQIPNSKRHREARTKKSFGKIRILSSSIAKRIKRNNTRLDELISFSPDVTSSRPGDWKF